MIFSSPSTSIKPKVSSSNSINIQLALTQDLFSPSFTYSDLMKITKMKVFFMSIIALFLVASHATETNSQDDVELPEPPTFEEQGTSSIKLQFRGANRLLAQKKITPTCDKFPQICSNRGSAGPHCCKKQCVNVMTDSLNCGMCGSKCKYRETCCAGRCVNLANDEKNCGRCNKKCNKGDVCVHGLCNYA